MINRQSVAICFSSQVLNNIFKCWFCVTQQEKNHFLFSAQSHANVSPSVHFSLLFPTTDDCVHTNTHTEDYSSCKRNTVHSEVIQSSPHFSLVLCCSLMIEVSNSLLPSSVYALHRDRVALSSGRSHSQTFTFTKPLLCFEASDQVFVKNIFVSSLSTSNCLSVPETEKQKTKTSAWCYHHHTSLVRTYSCRAELRVFSQPERRSGVLQVSGRPLLPGPFCCPDCLVSALDGVMVMEATDLCPDTDRCFHWSAKFITDGLQSSLRWRREMRGTWTKFQESQQNWPRF